jgi:hypothetical protein
MTVLAHLWLPILLSAIVVFALSAASHMVLPWRRNEWGRITDAGALQGAVRGLAPGQYGFPAAPDQKQQMTKEWQDRWAAGPSGWLTLARPGPMSMGRNMALSLLVFLFVAFVDAYLTAHMVGSPVRFYSLARVVFTVAFLSFAVGPIFNSIWYSRPWRAYLSDLVDAVLFSAAMAVVFGLLWPR